MARNNSKRGMGAARRRDNAYGPTSDPHNPAMKSRKVWGGVNSMEAQAAGMISEVSNPLAYHGLFSKDGFVWGDAPNEVGNKVSYVGELRLVVSLFSVENPTPFSVPEERRVCIPSGNPLHCIPA